MNTPSASGINKDIEQSLQTLEKNAIEKDLGAKGGAGHQEQGEEGEGWKMGDDQIRDVARLLTLGHKEVNLKERVQTLYYENQKSDLELSKSSSARHQLIESVANGQSNLTLIEIGRKM